MFDDLEPIPDVSLEDIILWNKMKQELSDLKDAEMALRKRIYRAKVLAPHEGTNKVILPNGWELKAIRTINRKVDIGAARVLSGPDGPFAKAGIVADTLIKWEPELEVKAYKGLLPEARKVFDQCLTIKDGSPSLELIMKDTAK